MTSGARGELVGVSRHDLIAS